ncbi:non-canonical purine NTP diphosphatase [Coprobacter fastidiosus]|jgi:XTP/dITP diphosphohydrolase|uniref:non-canonical purine NTP diphosphatase n=1 Tax=Coprobacter fastidiosus TaxID=1099853 RepID=UPI000240EB2F|nr:non-canonical purine NTP diphosphatase [Coprobacter fastidiosus]EHL84421.1 rdgB/HAM1 family non-canonical purine NTP pyrophosphatase [Tannerella sp. 6_1_58FAA_CT1]RHS50390.1 non-canonical purine NTP diphosphatase [Tannerella sp. AF04-6]
MKQIVFATNNKHKLEEIRNILDNTLNILSLDDINCHEDIPETGSTIEENALIKARYIKEKYGYDCFADDTGLEIKSLNNEPGVYSARYAGNDHNSEKNMQKVLENLKGKNDRSACFRTCIALITSNNEYLFEGKIEGEIITEKKGESGFGYDPIFVPDGYTQTFAELGNDIKNKISHRALAVKKLINFLQPIK